MEEAQVRKKGMLAWFAIPESPADKLVNFFNLFVLNATNYARIVGLLQLMVARGWTTKDLVPNRVDVRKHCTEYVKSVSPVLYSWRNKIIAHPSATDPYPGDDNSTLEISLMDNLSFMDPYFYYGKLKFAVEDDVSPLEEFSVTKIYNEILCPRYWPKEPSSIIA